MERLIKSEKGIKDNKKGDKMGKNSENRHAYQIYANRFVKTAKHILISFEILLPAFCMWDSEEEVLDYIENLVDLYFNGMRKR